jgi:hypothetical protein
MRDRLRGPGATPVPPRVVWQRNEQRVLLHLDSLALRALDGWLIAGLDLQTDPTGRQNLQIVYHLGKDGEDDGLAAAATLNAPTMPAAQLAERWGDDLHRVLWDAVLDTIELAVFRAGQQHPGEQITVQGIGCANNVVFVDVLTGAI